MRIAGYHFIFDWYQWHYHPTPINGDYNACAMNYVTSGILARKIFLLFSNDTEASASSLLYNYRAEDADEKLFSQIKVDMDDRRIRTHNEQTRDGKLSPHSLPA